jgi:hypothetical protein
MRYPCDVELIAFARRCGAAPARPFTAYCACGHAITGYACEACLLCQRPGCYTCWRGGAGHECPAEFAARGAA